MNRKCCGSFFMPKLRCKEVVPMFKDDIIEKFYSDKKVEKVPVLYAGECLKAMERVLEAEMEVKPYAELSELFQ